MTVRVGVDMAVSEGVGVDVALATPTPSLTAMFGVTVAVKRAGGTPVGVAVGLCARDTGMGWQRGCGCGSWYV